MPEARDAINELLKLGAQGGDPKKVGDSMVIVRPADFVVESLEKYQYPEGRPPKRIRTVVTLASVNSFCGYLELFKDDRTRVFADPANQSFNAVLDYHPAQSESRAPEFLSHRAKFVLKRDSRWNTWYNNNDRGAKPFNQVDFAEFIEDNGADIVNPPAAAMLEVARNLSATVNVSFGSSTRLEDGQTQLNYQEEIKATVGGAAGNLQIPESFTIAIPVFYGEGKVSIRVRLRFRIGQDKKLTFHYKMERVQQILDAAFDAAVANIGMQVSAQVLLGTVDGM